MDDLSFASGSLAAFVSKTLTDLACGTRAYNACGAAPQARLGGKIRFEVRASFLPLRDKDGLRPLVLVSDATTRDRGTHLISFEVELQDEGGDEG